MVKQNIAILFGGKSEEHEVSCRSAKYIFENVDRDKYRPFLIGIDKLGNYYYMKECNIEHLIDCTWTDFIETNEVCFSKGDERFTLQLQGEKIVFDVVFPALHGPNGEDGKLQGLMEFVNIPYVGCNSISSAICMDKEITKRLVGIEGVRQVPYVILHGGVVAEEKLLEMEEIGYPLFVKPANMGSSVGVSKAENQQELLQAIRVASKYDDKVIVEKGIDALELEIAALGDGKDAYFSTVGCIKPRDIFYDYDSKYLTNDADFYIPAPISFEKETELREMARKAYTAMLCEGLSRIDFFMDKETQEIYFNEINTMPGFTAISLYPQLMDYDGVGAKELIGRLIDYAWKRYEKNK